MCGEQMKLSNVNNGWSGLTGSSSKTSNAAPATLPFFKASYKSFSLTIPPRAQLMIRTLSFIVAMVAALIMFCVSLVNGVCTVMITLSTPILRARSSERYGS